MDKTANKDIVILESAHKHGFSDADILHAIEYNILSFEFEGKFKIILAYIGPSLAENLIEIFVDTDNPEKDIVFHAEKLTSVVEQEARKYLGDGDYGNKK
jgi:hypothetical protein